MNADFIQKLTLDFQFSTIQKGNEVMDNLRGSFYSEMLPVIENTFEKISPEESIRLQHVELDLGRISLDQLAVALELKLEALMIKIIYELKHPLKIKNYDIESDRILQDEKDLRHEKNLQDKKKDQILAFLHFLEYGYLPWYILNNNIDLQKTLSRILNDKYPDLLKRLSLLLNSHDAALARFIIQFSKENIKKLFNILIASYSDVDQNFLKRWMNYLFKTFVKAEDSSHIFLLKKTLKYLLSQHGSISKNDLLVFLFAHIPAQINTEQLKSDNLNTFEMFIEKVFLIISELSKKDVRWKNWIWSEIQEPYAEYSSIYLPKPLEKKPEHLIKEKNINDYVHEEYDTQESDPDKSFQITNAGLILLHPFLPAFFEELKFTFENKFINQKSQNRAALMLHYIATGSQKTPEFLLLLNKLLCSLPHHFPLPGKIKINDAEKHACDELLDAVIEHWKPIRGTSINGFRNSFLQRAGILKKEGDDWILRVEKKGYDILLEELPWSTSVIRQPWNKYIIFAEW